MTVQAELSTAPERIAAALVDLDDWLDETADVEMLAETYVALTQARADAKTILDKLTEILVAAMPEKRMAAAGKTFERRRATKRTEWETDEVLRLVLDGRRVDPETGEVESPVEAIRAVWRLGAPRVTALRERGIPPEDFCREEPGDLSLQVK